MAYVVLMKDVDWALRMWTLVQIYCSFGAGCWLSTLMVEHWTPEDGSYDKIKGAFAYVERACWRAAQICFVLMIVFVLYDWRT